MRVPVLGAQLVLAKAQLYAAEKTERQGERGEKRIRRPSADSRTACGSSVGC